MLKRLCQYFLITFIISLIISTFNPLYSQEDDLELYIGREIDPEPQGKTINKIILVILPPLTIDIIPIEFVVDAGNSLHTTTKKSVILKKYLYKKEMLLIILLLIKILFTYSHSGLSPVLKLMH